MEDLLKLQYQLTQDEVDPAPEMSKRGGHLWIFLATPLLARQCRIYIHDLATQLGVPVKGSGSAQGIEIFPSRNRMSSARTSLAMQFARRKAFIVARIVASGSMGLITL